MRPQIPNLLGTSVLKLTLSIKSCKSLPLSQKAKNCFKPQTSLTSLPRSSLNRKKLLQQFPHHIFPVRSLQPSTSHLFPNVPSLSPNPPNLSASSSSSSPLLILSSVLSLLPASSILDLGLSRLFLPSLWILLDQNHLS